MAGKPRTWPEVPQRLGFRQAAFKRRDLAFQSPENHGKKGDFTKKHGDFTRQNAD